MAESTFRFRTSLSGFHKGDVTAYLEDMAAQHRSEVLEYEKLIAELQDENRSLQQQLNLMMMATSVAAPEPAPAPEPVPEPVAAPVAAPVSREDVAELMHKELQAYRRAEAVERTANDRALKIYEQMETICGGALENFQSTDAAVKQAIEAMNTQAASLEQAYQTLSEALNASRETIAYINKQLSTPDDIA